MNNIKKLNMFLSMSWRVSHSYIFVLIFNILISGLQVFCNIIFPKYLIDEIVGVCDIKNLIFYGSLIVVTNLFFSFMQNLMKKLLNTKKIYIDNKLNQKMGIKIMNVSYSYLEDPYYLDLKERAVFAINNQGILQTLLNDISNVFKDIFIILGLIAILSKLSILIVIFLLISVIIVLFIYRSFCKYQVGFFQSLIPTNRKYGVYADLGFNDKAQKDCRIYDMSDMIIDKVTFYNKEINTWFTRFYRKLGNMAAMFSLISNFQAAVVNLYVGLRVITDKFGSRISLGEFTMYVSGAVKFSTTFIELGQSIVSTFQQLSYLDPFMEFMQLPDESKEEGKIKFKDDVESIKVEHLTFKYPKTDKVILDDISFEIKKGEKISIVGLNGAGKTTLVKLICRLFKPDSGNIFINGVDIFDYDYDSYMKKIATVFQDYKIFNFSIDENITCNHENSDTSNVMKLIEEVGLKDKVDSLKDGIFTKFGKQYDENGIEMSGGQSQKIAIARALYKNASFIILDEPTSALDPIAEAEIYEKFNDMVGDKTAIYISHRMSSSVFCDKVLIIDGGKVADFDAHENLMKKTDSLYYTLFNAQAVNYQE